MVVCNDNIREVWVIELTVCFETGYEEAHMRKITRYADLMEQIVDSGFDGELVTLEVGSHGFLELSRLTILQQQLLQCTKKQWRMLLDSVSQVAIKGSHKIWVMRNWTELAL